MDTNRKGNISEAKVLHVFVEAGAVALLPFGNGAPYDLVVDIGRQLLKVQVKTGELRDGCVIFSLLRHSGQNGKGQKYAEGEFDLFAIYCPVNDKTYLVTASFGQQLHEGRLRITATRNNQKRNIRWAAEFEFAMSVGNLKGKEWS